MEECIELAESGVSDCELMGEFVLGKVVREYVYLLDSIESNKI